MTPWERVQERHREIEARRRQRRRGVRPRGWKASRAGETVGPRAATPWQDIRLDEGTARAVEAVVNGPAPPREVAALAVGTADGWAVLVQRVGGAHDVERLTTLGECAPYLRAAMKVPAALWPADARRVLTARLARQAGDTEEVPGSPAAFPPKAEREVREALGAAVDDAATRAPAQKATTLTAGRERT